MKALLILAVLTIVSCSLTSCATPEDRHRRELQREKEDARWDAERRDRDRQRDADDYHFFLEDYAHRLGKSVPELSRSERAEARRQFEAEGGRHYEDYDRPYYWR